MGSIPTGIAIDELFGKSRRLHDTHTFRKTLKSNLDDLKEESRSSSVNGPSDSHQTTLLKKSSESQEGVDVVLATKVTTGVCQAEIRRNLIVLAVIWGATQINYSMINFYLKYVPGGLFLNISISGFSEILGHLTVGAFYDRVGMKPFFLAAHSIALIGGVCLLFQNKFNNDYTLSFFVLIAKYGVSMGYSLVYISTPFLFPTKVCGTAFGVIKLVGAVVSVAAPVVAELDIPIPMSVFSIGSLISICGAMILKSANQVK